MLVTYKIEGLHCGSCEKKVATALAGQAETIKVDRTRGELQLVASKLDAVGLRALIEPLGYRLGEVITPAPIAETMPQKNLLRDYFPLLLIVAYLLLVSLTGLPPLEEAMRRFMAGFFLVFSFFKLLDVRAFAAGYRKYDLLAAKVPAYGLVYPFIELGLGVAYLLQVAPVLVNIVTLVLMLLGAAGVLNSLRKGEALTCACLGTFLRAPLSTVTLVENTGMALMALFMLLR